jgi:hypothetical protein
MVTKYVLFSSDGLGHVNISRLKHRFSSKFPNNEFTQILLSEPDGMSIEVFISKVGTWLSILDYEKQQVLNSSTSQSKEVMK